MTRVRISTVSNLTSWWDADAGWYIFIRVLNRFVWWNGRLWRRSGCLWKWAKIKTGTTMTIRIQRRLAGFELKRGHQLGAPRQSQFFFFLPLHYQFHFKLLQLSSVPSNASAQNSSSQLPTLSILSSIQTYIPPFHSSINWWTNHPVTFQLQLLSSIHLPSFQNLNPVILILPVTRMLPFLLNRMNWRKDLNR